MLGKDSEAIADYTRALGWQPPGAARADLYEARALAFTRLGQVEKAVADLQQAVSLVPDHPAACNGLAWFYATGPAGMRAPAKALPLALAAVRRFPRNADYRNTLGVVYYRLGQYEQGLEALEQSVQDHQGEATAYDWYYLAMSYHQLGRAAQAQSSYEQAREWQKYASLTPGERAELEASRAEADAVLGRRPTP